MFKTNFYAKIFPNRIVVRNLSSGQTVEVVPDSPYLHPRLLIGNIGPAEFALAKGLKQIKSSNPLMAMHLLLHPVAEFPGGISEAEERLFRMIGYDARAAKVVLWVGSELSDDQVLDKLQHAK